MTDMPDESKIDEESDVSNAAGRACDWIKQIEVEKAAKDGEMTSPFCASMLAGPKIVEDLLQQIADMAEDFITFRAAETGQNHVPEWDYADTGDPLWTRWLGPIDEDGEETHPLLRVKQEHVGWWNWEVLGPKYKTLAKGGCRSALEAMRAAEQAATKEEP